jgi:hypothetical protein
MTSIKNRKDGSNLRIDSFVELETGILEVLLKWMLATPYHTIMMIQLLAK